MDPGYITRPPDSIQGAATKGQIPAFTFTEAESKLISVEVGELFHKQPISQTVSDDGFLSNIFLVPKEANGG